MKNLFTEKDIINAIESSPIWLDLNERIKAVYEKLERVPSEEEYQIMRNIMICKTLIDFDKY